MVKQAVLITRAMSFSHKRHMESVAYRVQVTLVCLVIRKHVDHILITCPVSLADSPDLVAYW